MPHQRFTVGQQVQARFDIANIARGTIGTIAQDYHEALGLYDVIFVGLQEPIVVHRRNLQLLPPTTDLQSS